MLDAVKNYLNLASGVTEVTRQRAVAAAKALASSGEATAEQVSNLADELIVQSRNNRDAMLALVRYEVDRALNRLGLATADEVASLQRRVTSLEGALAKADGSNSAPQSAEATRRATPGSGPAKKAAKRAPAKAPAKSPAKAATSASGASASTAASTAAKATAAKATAAKASPAKSSPAKSTAAKASPAKSATTSAATKSAARKAPAKRSGSSGS